MLLKIFKNRTVSSSGTWGTKNENNYEILNFEFPEELEEYNKRIVYYLGNQKVWDAIIDNKAILTNAITTKGSVKAYVWCTKSDEAFETDVDFRTQIFVMNFFENDNADGIVPTPEQVDGFNTMLTAMNEKIEEINELETTIENAETTRQEHEETRQENESTRQENEQTRQEQEAERERRTDEAIADIEDKTAEYNANAEAKTTAFNQNATQKTNEFNSNYTQKVNDFNSNASSKTTSFNNNATSKTTDFNTNAENKTTAFNSNATDKTTNFDNNANSKTTTFNENATSKTNDFNDNATAKTTAYNENAQDKIDEYDAHIVDYQAQIDDLTTEVQELSANMPWNETEQATSIDITDAAKYSKNKMKVFGNTSQDSTTGKNLFDNSVERKNAYPGGNIGGQIAYVNSNATYSYVKCAYLEAGKTYTISWQQNIAPASENDRISRIIDENNINLASFISWLSNSNSISYTPNVSGYLVLATDINSTNIMIEEGSTATDYEPYTGGQPSPSPDYPQPIHVVTGENTIKQYSKNLLYFPYSTYNWSGTSYINGSKIVIEGSAAISASVRVASKYNINIPRNTTVTFSVRILEGKEFFKKNWAQFGCNLYYDDGSEERLDASFHNPNYIDSIRFVTITILKKVVAIAPLWGAAAIGESGKFITFGIQMEIGSNITEYMDGKAAENYPINLGNIELCKIGDYQDYIYKENGNWYKDKNIHHSTFRGLSDWTYQSNNKRFIVTLSNTPKNQGKAFSNFYTNGETIGNNNYFSVASGSGYSQLLIHDERFTTKEDFNAWIENNNIEVYYILNTPTTTQITDETLIAQLEAIYNHLALVKGTNHITITPSDLAPYVTLNYMQDLPSKLDNLDSRLSLLE